MIKTYKDMIKKVGFCVKYGFLFGLMIFLNTTYSQVKENLIEGRVTDGRNPLKQATVAIKNTEAKTHSDNEGRYSIKAKPGDVLVFKQSGKETIEIIIEDVTTILNIKLVTVVHKLNEVVVKKRRKRSFKELEKEYPYNKRLIRTGFGIIDGERSAISMKVIDGSEISPALISLMDILQTKFPNVIVRNSPDPITRTIERRAFLRRNYTNGTFRSKPLLFEIDGGIYEDPPFIASQNIERIALLPGLTGTVRYGSMGAGGVIIINTKQQTTNYEPGTTKPFDTAKLRHNFFEEEQAKAFEETTLPNHLIQLRNSETLAKATRSYNNNKKLFGSKPHYYLDALAYFGKKWQNSEKTTEIREAILSKFGNNAVALKTLAYILEEQGKFEQAQKVYGQILNLRPAYAQSYRDLANTYVEIGNYKNALKFYSRYIINAKLRGQGNQNWGIDSIVLTELDHLIRNKPFEFENESKFNLEEGMANKGTRILFEWADSEAEFEIQFVNPDKQFYVWNHTILKNADRIKDEKLKGYSSEQFFIDESFKGKWQINLKYLGNKSYDPTYLKVTIWTEYGTSLQKKHLHLFRLQDQNVNYKVFTVMNYPRLVQN